MDRERDREKERERERDVELPTNNAGFAIFPLLIFFSLFYHLSLIFLIWAQSDLAIARIARGRVQDGKGKAFV